MRHASFVTALSLALQEAPRRRVSHSDYGRHRDVSSGTFILLVCKFGISAVLSVLLQYLGLKVDH